MTKTRNLCAALACSLLCAAAIAAPAQAAFGIQSFTGLVSDSGGATFSQAAGHPYEATTTIEFPAIDFLTGDDNVKDIYVDLPPGFVGNPEAIPAQCSYETLVAPGGLCPVDSQVGTAVVHLGTAFSPANVYKLVAPAGVAARFGMLIQQVPVVFDASVRSGADYGVTVASEDVSTGYSIFSAKVTLWGSPADPSHDGERGNAPPDNPANGNPCSVAAQTFGAPCDNPAGYPPTAFITNPADCAAGTMITVARADSWQEPGSFLEALLEEDTNGNPTAVSGCESVPFDPAISFQPRTERADSPAGLDVDLTMPSAGLTNPAAVAQAPLKRAVVTLPAGMSVNPASADGLGACTAQQVGLTQSAPEPQFSPHPAQCPDSSKIGTVEVDTPLLDHTLQGSVYLGAQDDPDSAGDENPFGTLLSLYIAVDDLQTGIILKLPGRVDPDPATGQLVATFDNNPQVPFSSLKLHFKRGERAPLVTPRECGSYDIVSNFSSWSAVDPDNPTPAEVVTKTGTFKVTSGPNGGPCPSPGQFDPGFQAGTLTPIAGAYSPLVVNASLPDGSQPLTGLRLSLPEGLTGKLAGVPYCPEPGVAQAIARNQPGQGSLELASPSCPAASQVGSVDVSAGAGATPYHVRGKAYLAGPYKGAPISLLVITPAVAGPFDLGVVAVRAALNVDPATAQITAVSDAIPQILHGIPLKIRSISVKANKPDFTLNPTNCEPMSLTGTLFGPGASAPVQNRFQVGACKGLDFAPRLALRVFGKTNRNAKPRFRAVLQSRPGEANIARAQVNLPHSEFLEQNHIKTVCTRVQWNAGAGHGGACPQGSIYGYARAWTPLLAEPLQGPVYLRSNGGERKLPDLVAALNGQVDIELQGKVDAGKNHGLRNTFEVVPDAPVSKFILTMAGGKKGLLVNSENLCSKKATTRAIVRFTGQNGAVHAFKPKVANGCGGKGKGKKRRRSAPSDDR